MKYAHVLLIPYPAQGHVTPLMDAARCLTRNGLKVTFVNTEFTHKRVMSACSEIDGLSDIMQIVSIPDGIESCDDRSDLGKLTKAVFEHMPTKLEELINDINKNNEEKIACIIADYGMGWVSRVAQKIGIRLAMFSPTSAAILALTMSIQKLINEEVINYNGVPLKDEIIQLSTTMPFMDPTKFNWSSWESGQLGTSTGGPKPSVGGLFHESLCWNSTMEGVSNGVPFLCWPYFAEQFFNKTYICDIWKIGVGLDKDDAGIVTREEIKIKVEELLSNNLIKENALSVQETVMNSLQVGNSSNKNLNNFIDWIKIGNHHVGDDETCDY
ncbi:hypothetical protein E3N88_06867 [Mikania micrantha]|uniref:Uncharacterized protein n=1 Tax=Mikania micrantha TaxID=192012 RepID=A0A5N6PQN5_9ASTR|nr:hypothetical protein E3N88_06867 [Mikania micrantha]